MSKNLSVNPLPQSETNKPETSESADIRTTNIGRYDQAKKSLTQAKDTFTRSASKVGRGVTTYATNATDYAKENPGKALAIAIGSGVALGYLIGTTTRRNTFWTTLSAAVIGTLADRIR